jgi:2-oxoglutarate ferredoxin oxidoreductase subunit alpha
MTCSKRIKCFVVPELNAGQMVREVERAAKGNCMVLPVTHYGGTVHNPNVILESIIEGTR